MIFFFVENRCESSTNNEKKSNLENWQTDHWNGDGKRWFDLYGKGLIWLYGKGLIWLVWEGMTWLVLERDYMTCILILIILDYEKFNYKYYFILFQCLLWLVWIGCLLWPVWVECFNISVQHIHYHSIIV